MSKRHSSGVKGSHGGGNKKPERKTDIHFDIRKCNRSERDDRVYKCDDRVDECDGVRDVTWKILAKMGMSHERQ